MDFKEELKKNLLLVKHSPKAQTEDSTTEGENNDDWGALREILATMFDGIIDQDKFESIAYKKTNPLQNITYIKNYIRDIVLSEVDQLTKDTTLNKIPELIAAVLDKGVDVENKAIGEAMSKSSRCNNKNIKDLTINGVSTVCKQGNYSFHNTPAPHKI